MRRAALLATVLAIAFVAPPLAAQDIVFPRLTGRVVDQANVMSATNRGMLAEQSARLERATTNQFVIATIPSLQGRTIEEFGYRLGRDWGIGRAGANNGVLLLVAPTERQVRIEVGYGLEGALTDAVAKGIIESVILPRFRQGDLDGGVRAGADAIYGVLSGDTTAAARLAEAGSRKIFGRIDPGLLLFVAGLAVMLALFIRDVRRAGGWREYLRRQRRRQRRRSGVYVDGFDSNTGGFGGSGGGGFSGGGGSFGGGGASGRW